MFYFTLFLWLNCFNLRILNLPQLILKLSVNKANEFLLCFSSLGHNYSAFCAFFLIRLNQKTEVWSTAQWVNTQIEWKSSNEKKSWEDNNPASMATLMRSFWCVLHFISCISVHFDKSVLQAQAYFMIKMWCGEFVCMSCWARERDGPEAVWTTGL